MSLKGNSLNKYYLGLGSNLDNPFLNIYKAIKLISDDINISVEKTSSLYKSKAIGLIQDNYVNAVIEINTNYEPEQLFSITSSIENKLLRKRVIKWGPRTIDIDILLFNNLKIKTKNLIIPHEQMLYRNFVVIPLLEIAPDMVMPDLQKLKNIAFYLGNKDLVRL